MEGIEEGLCRGLLIFFNEERSIKRTLLVFCIYGAGFL